MELREDGRRDENEKRDRYGDAHGFPPMVGNGKDTTATTLTAGVSGDTANDKHQG
jgi:hypothetical protein